MALSLVLLSACSDFNHIESDGFQITQNQVDETVKAVPERLEASLVGMYSYMGMAGAAFPSTMAADDGGYPTVCLSQDLNGADMVSTNSVYNTFWVCSQYNDRIYTYTNPAMRFAIFYNQIKLANNVIRIAQQNMNSPVMKSYMGQAMAVRAFDYLCLVPYYQFNYSTSRDKPCVPLVTEQTTSFTNLPRSSVEAVYTQIMSDLNAAIELLKGYDRKGDRSRVDLQVVYGLRARANLYMGHWKEAADDADQALAGYTPASMQEVNCPSFAKIDHNWIWGIDVSSSNVEKNRYATVASHLSSFSSYNYTGSGDCYKRINPLLFNKVPATDVRKGWWVDEILHSDALKDAVWQDAKGNYAKGDDIASADFSEVKQPFNPYTNVKFGIKSGIGSTVNDNDWPIMRAEEMILIKAEGLAMSSGTFEDGKQVLAEFVKTYRNPDYTCMATTPEALQTEIWFQRRVELWGEGFAMSDIMRLNKPLVRFHGTEKSSWPDEFCFNISANDPWLLLRFPQKETNSNIGIVNNAGGAIPVSMQNPHLRDGVTD